LTELIASCICIRRWLAELFLPRLAAALILATVSSVAAAAIFASDASAAIAPVAAMAFPVPPDTSPTAGVAPQALKCPTADWCAAVGYYFTTRQDALLAIMSGGVWTASKAPLPADAVSPIARVNSLSCPSVGSCYAVAGYRSTNGGAPLLLTFASGTWTATRLPVPAGGVGGSLNSLACPTSGFCAAGGFYTDAANQIQGLLLTLSGGTWAATTSPIPPDANATPYPIVRSVACGAPGSCAAVGNYGVGSPGRGQALLLALSGNTWSVVQPSLPPDADASAQVNLPAVACPGAGSCVAVGSYSGIGNSQRGLVLTQAGQQWTASELFVNGGSPSPLLSLSSVACPAVGSCTAVGDYRTDSNQTAGLWLQQTGSTWAHTLAPVPPDAAAIPFASLRLVDCSAPGVCMAVGRYQSTGGGDGYVVTTAVPDLIATKAPAPTGAAANPSVYLTAVACPSTASCTAVGEYTNQSGYTQGVIESPVTGPPSNVPEAPWPIALPISGAIVGFGVLHRRRRRPQQSPAIPVGVR
jgi:hypothetical protein